MIVSVTVLGSNGNLSPQEVGRRIAEYLEGGRTCAVGGRTPGELIDLAAASGAAAYYADSAGLRPGRWVLGDSAQGRSGEVDANGLATLLAGVDPATGAPLISAAGSAGRALRQRGESIHAELDRDWYSVGELLKSSASLPPICASCSAKRSFSLLTPRRLPSINAAGSC